MITETKILCSFKRTLRYRSLVAAATDAKVYGLGGYANLWSSSPNAGSEGARSFGLSPGAAYAGYYNGRAGAFSVRCFKNSYLSFPSSEGGASTGQVTLTLTEWQNSCILNDYNLGTHNVSWVDQAVQSESQVLVCEFLQNSWFIVSISMWNLAEWVNKIIWAENFTWNITQWTYLWSISNLTWWSYNLSWTHEIYRKQTNTIWMWTWTLQIEWIIPAWTPSGSYTWALDIIIQAGA